MSLLEIIIQLVGLAGQTTGWVRDNKTSKNTKSVHAARSTDITSYLMYKHMRTHAVATGPASEE